MPRHHSAYKMRAKEQYAGYEESKKMMGHDGGMIHEMPGNFCLLPENVIAKDWPASPDHAMYASPDLFEGAQRQLHEDKADLKRIMKPGKY